MSKGGLQPSAVMYLCDCATVVYYKSLPLFWMAQEKAEKMEREWQLNEGKKMKGSIQSFVFFSP